MSEALDADDMSCLMIVDSVSMVPLLKSLLLQFDKYKCPDALLLPPGSERKEASVCTNSTMLQAL